MKNGMKSRIAAFVLVLLMALQALPLGILSFANEAEGGGEEEKIPVTYTAEDYNAIYVDGGNLTFAWDAFDITESFDGKMVSWTDGASISRITA